MGLLKQFGDAELDGLKALGESLLKWLGPRVADGRTWVAGFYNLTIIPMFQVYESDSY
jgi:hypothetical protein